MKSEEVKDIICIEFFKQMIERLENRILDKSFKNELKYNCSQINDTMSKDFNDIVVLLQSIVDKFYFNYYKIEGFQLFSLDDFDYCVSHNISLINNCKKLLKFANF